MPVLQATIDLKGNVVTFNLVTRGRFEGTRLFLQPMENTRPQGSEEYDSEFRRESKYTFF